MSKPPLLSYLFVIDSSTMKLSEALDKINELREVENWHTVLPDAAILISRLSVSELQKLIIATIPSQKYILTLLERGNKSGWLAKSAWSAMNSPTSVFD